MERGGESCMQVQPLPFPLTFGSVDLIGKAADSKSVVWRKLRVWVRVLPFPRNFWRIRLIGKSAVLKTAAVRLGGSSPSSSAKVPFCGTFLF